MSFNLFKTLLHLVIIILLTLLTQIGGLIYLITISIIKKRFPKYKLKRFLFFSLIYILATFFIVPKIAPLFGRVKIDDNEQLASHNFITQICNRNYVTPKMKLVLDEISLKLSEELPEIKLIYLDTNFPFLDGFPLLPHLSHNDGKKIDVSFIYQNKKGKVTNNKPSVSGYGIFVEPLKDEINQTKICKEQGYWQYDFTKYLTFGAKNGLELSEVATKKLIQIIINNKEVHKIFIEPHLKTRLKLNNQKIRFHGCRAVRHDDHIHFQIQ